MTLPSPNATLLRLHPPSLQVISQPGASNPNGTPGFGIAAVQFRVILPREYPGLQQYKKIRFMVLDLAKQMAWRTGSN